MKRKNVTMDVLCRIAMRSTRASAALENRAIPEDMVRSDRVELFLARRRQKA